MNFNTVKVFIDFNSTAYQHIWWYDIEKRWDTTALDGNQLCDFAGYSDAERVYFPGVQGRKYKGTFSGNTFTGTCTGGSLSITISGDLKSVTSLSCSFNGESDLKNFQIQSSSLNCTGLNQSKFQADYMAEYTAFGPSVISSIEYTIACKNATDNSFNKLNFKKSGIKSILIRLENL